MNRQDRIAATPAYKGVTGIEDKEIPTFRNAQELTSANATAASIEFFPKQPADSDADSNYVAKPFVGDRRYFLAALSLQPSFHALRQDPTVGDIDLVTFYNQLSHAKVVFKGKMSGETLLQEHISNFMELDLHAYEAEAYEDSSTTAGFNEVITFRDTGPFVLPEPLEIGKQEVFELRVDFNDVSAFPTETEWGNLAQGGIMKLIAKMQVAYNPNQ